MEYLMNYWRGIVESKTNQQGPLYAEGGPLKPDELQGTLYNTLVGLETK